MASNYSDLASRQTQQWWKRDRYHGWRTEYNCYARILNTRCGMYTYDETCMTWSEQGLWCGVNTECVCACVRVCDATAQTPGRYWLHCRGVGTVTVGMAMALPLFRQKTFINIFNRKNVYSWVLVLPFQQCRFEVYLVGWHLAKTITYARLSRPYHLRFASDTTDGDMMQYHGYRGSTWMHE